MKSNKNMSNSTKSNKSASVNINSKLNSLSLIIGVLLLSANASGDNVQNENKVRKTLEEIIVTAQKKGVAENIQDIPIAISAFGSDQLEKMNIQDITDIGSRVPNAIIENMGSNKGVAGFSIRGQHSFDSIPSIEPKVSTFVDGMYYGINNGVIFDTFDIESIEVLRGPQGILFGRNSVGGAVRITTKNPTDEFTAEIKTSVDSGFRGTGENYTTSGSVSGPIAEKLNGKLAVYRNDDRGWFENKYDGSDFGKSTTTVIRGALDYMPTDKLQFLLKLENGDQEGQGQPAQSHVNRSGVPGLFSRSSHDLALNNKGRQENEWSQAILETTYNVDFGEGTIKNITGWREYEQNFCGDIDSTPNDRFNANCLQFPTGSKPAMLSANGLEHEQFSTEFIYNGTFGEWLDLTMGVNYFEQDIKFGEIRSIAGGAVRQSNGGIQDHNALGVFVNGDFNISEKLVISAGIRYSEEEKDVKTTAFNAPKPNATIPGFCQVVDGSCPYDFIDDHNWSNVDYKIGFSYHYAENSMLYGSYSTGFRAGGYNVRNTNVTDLPGPINEEFVDSYEIGFKIEPTDRLRINSALFYSFTEDAQRSIFAVGQFGPLQTIANVADVEVYGLEVDSQYLMTDSLTMNLSIGYLDADYDKISTDLTGDGIINSKDYDLDIPNVADLNYAVSINHESEISDFGSLSSTLSFTYRSKRELTTDNAGGFSESQRLLNANFSFIPANSKLELSLYGKNLLDEVIVISDTQLPASVGSTYSVLGKGRVIGVQAKYAF